MRVLIDITHPAYAHFFREVLPALRSRGHEVRVTSRDKDVTLALLDAFGIEHECLSRAGGSPPALLREMLLRVWRLRRVIRRFRPDVVLARDGLFACQAAWLGKVPGVSIDDTDDAWLQRRLYFPFASRIYTDHAYDAFGSKQRCYRGISCLAYLHPDRFRPEPTALRDLGLDASERLLLVRLVSWTASHDYGHRGFDQRGLRRLFARLAKHGRVLLSSERPLEADLEPFRLAVPPERLHSVLAGCALYVGESASMAAEAAILGVPAVHVSTRRLWYTQALARLGMVTNVENAEACQARAEAILANGDAGARQRRRRDRYLRDTDDLVSMAVAAVEDAGFIGRSDAGTPAGRRGRR